MSLDEICLCVVGIHEECNDYIPHPELGERGIYTCCCHNTVEITPSEVSHEGERGWYKENGEVRDVLSTGRKRAAELYPIHDGMVCEWSGLRYAGGGVIPIIGCRGTTLIAEKGNGANTGHIHHGPDKNTLNNEEGNCHRVCTTCHNRWHTLNDPYYGDRPPNGEPFLPVGFASQPHDPNTQATIMQQFNWERWWQKKPKEREDIFSVDFGE